MPNMLEKSAPRSVSQFIYNILPILLIGVFRRRVCEVKTSIFYNILDLNFFALFYYIEKYFKILKIADLKFVKRGKEV